MIVGQDVRLKCAWCKNPLLAVCCRSLYLSFMCEREQEHTPSKEEPSLKAALDAARRELLQYKTR